jgi:hypothetical protein
MLALSCALRELADAMQSEDGFCLAQKQTPRLEAVGTTYPMRCPSVRQARQERLADGLDEPATAYLCLRKQSA